MEKPYFFSAQDHNGWYYVVRRSDGVNIGRVWREGKTWAGRFYKNGGGHTTGEFKTRTAAADHVYKEAP